MLVGADENLSVRECGGTAGEFTERVGGEELEIRPRVNNEGLPLGVGHINAVTHEAHGAPGVAFANAFLPNGFASLDADTGGDAGLIEDIDVVPDSDTGTDALGRFTR